MNGLSTRTSLYSNYPGEYKPGKVERDDDRKRPLNVREGLENLIKSLSTAVDPPR